MAAELEVEGLRNLVRKLEQAGAEASDLKQAFNRIANIVVYEAQALAPKRSGALASSIRAANSKNKSVIRAGGARIPYAMPIHWGWPRRNIEAQPFMNDAVESKRQTVMDQFELEIRRLIAKIDN